MNPNAVAPGHSNPGKGNDLLTNNANYIKTVYSEYGDGQTAGQEGGVLGKKLVRDVFTTYTHGKHEWETTEPRSHMVKKRRQGKGDRFTFRTDSHLFQCLDTLPWVRLHSGFQSGLCTSRKRLEIVGGVGCDRSIALDLQLPRIWIFGHSLPGCTSGSSLKLSETPGSLGSVTPAQRMEDIWRQGYKHPKPDNSLSWWLIWEH